MWPQDEDPRVRQSFNSFFFLIDSVVVVSSVFDSVWAFVYIVLSHVSYHQSSLRIRIRGFVHVLVFQRRSAREEKNNHFCS